MTDPTVITLHANGLLFTALERGPAEAPAVLLLHGFPDEPDSFRHQIGRFAEVGYRVIAPTMRGYEPSSQPADRDYSLIALADDVIGWLDDLGIDQAHVVGHDWGAAVAYLLGWRHPDRLRSITAMAVPPLARIPGALKHVPRQLLRSWYMTWFQTPKLAERSLAGRDGWLVHRLWRSWSPGYSAPAEARASLRRRFVTAGVIPAALGYYRANATPPILLGLRRTEAMATEPVGVPTLIMHGADDGCLDRRLYPRTIVADDFPAGVRHEELSDCGHFLHLERPDYCADLVLEHLRSVDATAA